MKPIWSIQHTERLTGFIFLEAELFRNVSCNFYKHNIESWLLLSGSTTLEASFLDAFNLHLAHGFLMALLLSCAPQLIGLHTHCAKASNKIPEHSKKPFRYLMVDLISQPERGEWQSTYTNTGLFIHLCMYTNDVHVCACVCYYSQCRLPHRSGSSGCGLCDTAPGYEIDSS